MKLSFLHSVPPLVSYWHFSQWHCLSFAVIILCVGTIQTSPVSPRSNKGIAGGWQCRFKDSGQLWLSNTNLYALGTQAGVIP